MFLFDLLSFVEYFAGFYGDSELLGHQFFELIEQSSEVETDHFLLLSGSADDRIIFERVKSWYNVSNIENLLLPGYSFGSKQNLFFNGLVVLIF